MILLPFLKNGGGCGLPFQTPRTQFEITQANDVTFYVQYITHMNTCSYVYNLTNKQITINTPEKNIISSYFYRRYAAKQTEKIC